MSPRAHWTLDAQVTFLNHGSFGACPRVVLEEQSRLRARLEAEPVRFMVRELEPLADEARRRLGALVGADPEELVFVRNATEGVNTVLRSIVREPGGELLCTSHGYNAVANALAEVAEAAGCRVRRVPLPWPVADEQQIVDAVSAALGPAARLLVVDHVTSPTALVLPVERIIEAAAARGVAVLVDGAHAPGMLPLDLSALGRLGCAYYVGNLHKWLCAPKGVGFLWARRELQAALRPLVVSHGRNSPRTDRSRFRLEHDWTGTHDPTPYLCVPAAIDFLERLSPGGLREVMRQNRALALEARALLLGALPQPTPAPESMIGAMAAVALPDGAAEQPRSPLYSDPLQDALLFQHRIEVPVAPFPAPPGRVLRISAQRYNELDDYRKLAAALRALL